MTERDISKPIIEIDSLPDLLNRLRELDLKTWNDYMNGMIKRGSDLSAPLVMTSVQKAWLQYVIQDAIAERGWEFQLCLFQNPKGYGVSIIINETWIEPQNSDYSSVEAFLGSYLKVLEGKQ